MTLVVRHALKPGDIGRIVSLHGTLYAQECGWDYTFEAYVAVPLGEFAKRNNPRERIWLVDSDGELSASAAIVEASPADAQLRWLLVMPQLRRSGIGRRIVTELIDFARARGYSSIFLRTEKRLTAAAALYLSLGFRLTEETSSDLWGSRVTEQRYDLRL